MEAAAGILIIIYLAVVIFYLAATWRIYTKAGQPGWAAIIPIYNIIVLLKIAEMPVWYILFLLIPFVNIIFGIILWVEILKRFGKPGWHVILILFFGFIYIPVLAFGSAQYKKEGGEKGLDISGEKK